MKLPITRCTLLSLLTVGFALVGAYHFAAAAEVAPAPPTGATGDPWPWLALTATTWLMRGPITKAEEIIAQAVGIAESLTETARELAAAGITIHHRHYRDPRARVRPDDDEEEP